MSDQTITVCTLERQRHRRKLTQFSISRPILLFSMRDKDGRDHEPEIENMQMVF